MKSLRFLVGLLLTLPLALIAQSDPSPVTQSELAQIRPAVQRDLAHLMQTLEGEAPKSAELRREFSQCKFSHVDLGQLGTGILVEAQPGHGAGANAAMLNVYLRRNGSYERLVEASGFGPQVVPRKENPPDLVFGWAMGVCHATFFRYRYVGRKYVADACDQQVEGQGDSCEIAKCANSKLPTFENPWDVDPNATK